jgi:hypothetical protein
MINLIVIRRVVWKIGIFDILCLLGTRMILSRWGDLEGILGLVGVGELVGAVICGRRD